jgi:ATP-binding cassette, subfamily B, multidrug efflux pump
MMRMDGPRQLMERETSKPKNLSATLARFGHYFRRYTLNLVAVTLFVVIATWSQVTAPEIIGEMFDCYLTAPSGLAAVFANNQAAVDNCTYTDDDAQAIRARVAADPTLTTDAQRAEAETNAKLGGVVQMIGVLAGLFVLGAVFNGLGFFVMSWTGQHVLRDMRRDLFAHMQRLSLGFYAKNEAGNIMSRVTSDTDTIQQVFGFALLSVFSGILLIVWIMFNMLISNWVYALISLTVVPIMLIATSWFSAQARAAFRNTREQMGSVNANLQQSIAGVREVQAFNREEETMAEFERANAANRVANVRASAFTSALQPVLEALSYVAIGIVVLAGGYSVLQNQPLLGIGAVISFGTVIAFLQYVQRFNQPIQQIAILWTNIQSGIAGGERIFNLLDETPDVVDMPNAKPLPPITGHVRFSNVTAEYVRGEPVLQGVNFEAQPGQMIAIVGPTGAGKTTIINLLPRFYDATGGTVSIDGHNVRDVTLESLRAQIGIVLQDTFLFSDTVMNNIRYGRPDATDEQVIAAAKLVSADTFIEKLSDKYETILGERGSGLSQGQRQLIAIARVALSEPRLLILDEATSSVDTRTELLIQKAFERLLKGRTTFVIAHRLSTIRNADGVLLLKQGQIVERGTHHELLAKRGAYYDLYMSQFQKQEQAEASPTPVAP